MLAHSLIDMSQGPNRELIQNPIEIIEYIDAIVREREIRKV